MAAERTPIAVADGVITILATNYAKLFPGTSCDAFEREVVAPSMQEAATGPVAKRIGVDAVTARKANGCPPTENEKYATTAVSFMAMAVTRTERARHLEMNGELQLAWCESVDAMRLCGLAEGLVAVILKLTPPEVAQGRRGGNAKSETYEPLRKYARELAQAKRFPSKRQAAIAIKEAVLKKAKELDKPLSEQQALITIGGWIKGLPSSGKHEPPSAT